MLKYKDLVIKLQRMWDVKANVICYTGNKRGDWNHFKIRQNLSNIRGKHEIKELQKNSPFGHWTHTTQSANIKVQNAATLHTLETWFISGI
jgi:hypothetical protein